MGGSSLQREDGVILADRQSVSFDCSSCGERTAVVFAAEAEVPAAWECRYCGSRAIRAGADSDAAAEPEPTSSGGRTPWEMLLERRTIPELEEILQERLEWLRARRGESDAE